MWSCDKLVEILLGMACNKIHIVDSGVSKSFCLLVNLASAIGPVPVDMSHRNVEGGGQGGLPFAPQSFTGAWPALALPGRRISFHIAFCLSPCLIF